MSGSITPFPAWRQPHLYAVAEAQHAHLQLSGQLVAVAGCAVGTAKQGDRLLAPLADVTQGLDRWHGGHTWVIGEQLRQQPVTHVCPPCQRSRPCVTSASGAETQCRDRKSVV